MNPRLKSIIFIGIVAMAALIAIIIVKNKADAPQPGEYDSPALKASKDRIKK